MTSLENKFYKFRFFLKALVGNVRTEVVERLDLLCFKISQRQFYTPHFGGSSLFGFLFFSLGQTWCNLAFRPGRCEDGGRGVLFLPVGVQRNQFLRRKFIPGRLNKNIER